MAAALLVPLDEMMARFERVLATSPADATEIAWIEVRRAQAVSGRGRHEIAATERLTAASAPAPAVDSPGSPRRERSLLVRVRQSGRTGLYRTGAIEPGELENAVREALAQARLAPATPAEPLAGAAERRGERSGPLAEPAAAQGAATPTAALFDEELAELEPGRARELLERAAAPGEQLRLSWLEGRVAVANSAGLRRTARVTAASFAARCGRGAGAGSVTGSARRLEALGLADLLERARSRHAGADAGTGAAEPGGAEATAVPVSGAAAAVPGSGAAAAVPTSGAAAALPEELAMVLSEQGAAALLDLLNRHALSSAAHRDAAGFLHRRLGETVLASCLSLRDDGTDPRALPFPFDLAGWPKRPVDLVANGVFTTPAVDPRLAHEIGRQPTPHAMAPDESVAANLLLLPGDRAPLAETDLLRQAADGIWIGELGVECFDTRHLRFRALARGVRRIIGGALGPPLPDLLWEDSLPAALARALALGDRPLAVATGDMLFGATAAPLLALRGGGRLSSLSRRA